MEFDSHERYWVRLGRSGSSGRDRRYLSRAALKTSREQSLMFLISAGRELKSLGPLWGKVAKRIDLIRSDAVEVIGGGIQDLPRLSFSVTIMGVDSKLGTSFSRILQMYITW